jgi:hypothetical protein
MAKYSTEFKKKIVAEYLKGNIGYNKHRIKAKLGWLSPVNSRLSYAAA